MYLPEFIDHCIFFYAMFYWDTKCICFPGCFVFIFPLLLNRVLTSYLIYLFYSPLFIRFNILYIVISSLRARFTIRDAPVDCTEVAEEYLF